MMKILIALTYIMQFEISGCHYPLSKRLLMKKGDLVKACRVFVFMEIRQCDPISYFIKCQH